MALGGEEMPLSEQSITTGGTFTEQVIPGDDTENLADGGPAEMGRADVHLKFEEQSITSQ